MNKTYQLVQCSLTFQSDERIHVKCYVKWEIYISVSRRARIVVVGPAVSKRAKGIKKMPLLKKSCSSSEDLWPYRHLGSLLYILLPLQTT